MTYIIDAVNADGEFAIQGAPRHFDGSLSDAVTAADRIAETAGAGFASYVADTNGRQWTAPYAGQFIEISGWGTVGCVLSVAPCDNGMDYWDVMLQESPEDEIGQLYRLSPGQFWEV